MDDWSPAGMVTLLLPEGAHFFSDWLDIYKGLPYIKPKRVLVFSYAP